MSGSSVFPRVITAGGVLLRDEKKSQDFQEGRERESNDQLRLSE